MMRIAAGISESYETVCHWIAGAVRWALVFPVMVIAADPAGQPSIGAKPAGVRTGAGECAAFVESASVGFGDAGRRAAQFLVDNMPSRDRESLGSVFLMENLSLAFAARTNFAWAKAVPERLFLNDVLPYASLDEPRDPWRARMFPIAADIVRDCTNATEAAQRLNRDLFNRLDVHYNLGRKRSNQSPSESIEQHKATCTGLAILLVDACRAVGIPARIAGVPKWAHKDGNHTWTEIWDGGWHFAGADEHDPLGLDRGWFRSDAAKSVGSTNPMSQVYATSWCITGTSFPLAWNPASQEVPAVHVSARYAAGETATDPVPACVYVRLRDRQSGERLPALVEMRDAAEVLLATNYTRSGAADLNDMPVFKLPENASSIGFRFIRGEVVREQVVPRAACVSRGTLDFVWDELPLVPPGILAVETWLAKSESERGSSPDIACSRSEAVRMVSMAWEDLRKRRQSQMEQELAAKKIVMGDHTLIWLERAFGESPDGRRSLWITLHGGGQASTGVNDQNWRGYFGRYTLPPGSINVAPRAPADSWDLWHVNWVDGLLDRLIADHVAHRGVDPNRVYLIGYSAGGDGVYQLAPRMADRYAAASMCAGHPNEVTPDGLRNLPFFLFMGEEDAAYRRNVVVREFSAKMDGLQREDPPGYIHRLAIFSGLSHDMQNRESEMIPLMSPLRRIAWPRRVVWKQDDSTLHTRFYWLEREEKSIKPGEIYAAHVDGQTITLETPSTGALILRLSDELVDLDKPVVVMAGGKRIFEGRVTRTFAAILNSLREREDPDTAATALLPVTW